MKKEAAMKKMFLFSTVLFSFVSLYAGWGADLCDDVTCSGHGECQEDGEDEWCACDEGYIVDGLDCILGCDGVTCSGHGVCSVVSGAEVCSCETGFSAEGLNCFLNEASTTDTLAILNGIACYNTGNCHYRLIFAKNAYHFTPSEASLYDIIVNVLDSENVWHNYRKTVAQCVTEGVCDNVDSQYIDFWFQHEVNGNQYVTAEVLGNGDDAYDDMYHDVLIDLCYGIDCGTGGTCDGTSGTPVCTCGYGYVLRNGYCEEGWFEDENLAAAVVELLQYKGYDVETETDIDPEMLEDITHLPLKGKSIASLGGIGLFSSLSVLDISGNSISDLSPLAGCTGLTVLNMSGNPANDISPLGTLPLVSLDISYSGVYDPHPLASVSSLKEIVFADTENGFYGSVRPDGSTVQGWLGGIGLWECNGLIRYGDQGGKYGVIDKSGGCPAHGSCVSGKCVCDDGYIFYAFNNTCFNPNSCDTGTHPDVSAGVCEPDERKFDCGDLPENSKIASDDRIIWSTAGQEYQVPAGKITDLCHSGESGCGDSICIWDCKTGFTAVGDVCVPLNASRMIRQEAYNSLILPDIFRRDVALEPVPGVPSFAPVLKAGIYYDEKKELVTGWHLDLPRAELRHNSFRTFLPTYGWDLKTVYLYLPWGKEEYSLPVEKKCFDEEHLPLTHCETYEDLLNAARVEMTFYPAPGQDLFSYIVLETTAKACLPSINYNTTCGTYFYGPGPGTGTDRWRITRYGEDGSVTEFSRGGDFDDPLQIAIPRPAQYTLMDYIPVSKYTTRDGKETSFKYEWDLSETVIKEYSHYNIRSVTVTDPLKRVIKITSSDPNPAAGATPNFGLAGSPDPELKSLYRPLEGVVEISVGRALSNGAVDQDSLKTVAVYSFEDGFDMSAEIYKGDSWYRRDTYSRTGNKLTLSSLAGKDQVGETEWTMTATGSVPDGYTERKLVKGSSEYLVKRVNGAFYQGTQRVYPEYYSSFYSPLNPWTVTVYSHEKGSETNNERIVEDYFTNWLQPTKRVTCEPAGNQVTSCAGNTTASVEEIGYNAAGSPVYFKNADGQITVNLYDTTGEVSPQQYMIHYLSDPADYSNASIQVTPDFIRTDNLHKSGTLACSAVYSLDADENAIGAMLSQYISEGIVPNSGWCSNAADRRVTNYGWQRKYWEKPYDLKTVTYPGGKTKTVTYDYDLADDGVGKVRGETVTGSDSQNQLQTCYEYDENYQLVSQGIGTPSNCVPKKGFAFGGAGGLLMTRDFSIDENDSEVLENNYIYDYLGRKLVERNSAGVSTVYVYDSLDRVVFTFFGCNVDSESFGTVYNPYNFDNDDSVGENGTGVTFQTVSGQFPYSENAAVSSTKCQYYRKYNYDAMSNLTETYFFEYWGVNQNNQIEPLTNPKVIKQKTEYDMLGRAIKSCQYDGTISEPEDDDQRCIETEHDIFGNITKKTENGEVRTITYDLRNRPLTVTVDGLTTEQYSYSNAASGGYFGHDTISNKYGKTLMTYKDKWKRAAKQVDPFGNETVTNYESSYSDNIISQITTTSSEVKTGETTWTYDDLDRKLTETRKQFIPGSESTTNVNHVTRWDYDSIGNVVSVESSDGTKLTYSYDTLNRPVKTVNYEKINSNDVATSYSQNFYDANGRLFRTETTKNNQTITEDYGFDTFGRVVSVKTTDPANSSRYRVKFYNTGGQVIWEADEESDGTSYSDTDLNILNVEVGNEKYYTYNAFGDLEKTVYVMTDSGIGNDENLDLNPWLNSGKITTNYEYDIFGRITSRTNDRSGITKYNYYPNTEENSSRNKLESIQIFPAPYDGDTDFKDEESVAQTYTYTYDEYGDEASVEYEEGNYSMLVNFTRDAFGRITGKTSNGSVPVMQTFTYSNRNLLETATDTVGNATTSVTRYYDSFGNPYSEAVSANNITKTVSRRMTDAKTYQFTYSDGKIIRKTATGSDLDSIEYNNSELASYSRTDGVLTAVTKGQNLTETFSYNTWNQLENHNIKKSQTDVYDMTYGYSRGWHLIEKADGIKNTSDKYSYDSYYRLKEVKYDFANNTAARTDSFYQDGVHNIEQSTENGVTFAWGVDKLNRLRDKKVGGNTAVTYKYDERNNMIGEDFDGSEPADISYIYDDLNRLIEVKDGSQNTIATYTYDAFNRRITKTVGSTTERYSYDDWNIVEISTNSNLYTNIIDSGTDRHIAIEVSANNTSMLYYFLTDERGNVTALTDANGNILERYRYRVYGDFEILDSQFSPKNCNNQTCYATNLHNFLWGGSLYEPETGLYWMRNRYYHIDMHRFINQDPIGIWGDANNLGNGFAYVAGMVIEASDPSGLQEVPSWISTFAPRKTYEYNIAAGKSEEVATRNAGFTGVGVSLYCSPTTNFFDTFSTIYDILDLMNSIPEEESFNMSFQEEYSSILPDENPWKEIYDNNWLFVAKRDIEGQISGYERLYAKHKYVNTQTGEERYEFEDGTVVLKSPNGEESCSGPSCGRLGNYPSGPDSTDSVQTYFAYQFIKKILEMREKKSFFEMMEEEGPVIKYDYDGRKIFIFNPYYRGKDPLKEIFWSRHNADGTKGFVRNPFAPRAEYGYNSTTYQKWQNKGFIQTNVDPYWQ